MINVRLYLLSVLALMLHVASPALSNAQETLDAQSNKTVDTEASTLQSRLLGAWLLAGKPDTTEEPKAGARMRFRSESIIHGPSHGVVQSSTAADSDPMRRSEEARRLNDVNTTGNYDDQSFDR